MMHTLKHILVVPMLVVMTLSCLPIPSRGQTTSSSNNNMGVQFPSSVPSCATCKPAFASQACQTVLASMAQLQSMPSSSSSSVVSNATLLACQCDPGFLKAYNSCLDCFLQTDQLDLVFGTGVDAGTTQVPTLQGLESYCTLHKSSPEESTSKTSSSLSSSSSSTTDTPDSSVAPLPLSLHWALQAVSISSVMVTLVL